jgi:hypothetical protein
MRVTASADGAGDFFTTAAAGFVTIFADLTGTAVWPVYMYIAHPITTLPIKGTTCSGDTWFNGTSYRRPRRAHKTDCWPPAASAAARRALTSR